MRMIWKIMLAPATAILLMGLPVQAAQMKHDMGAMAATPEDPAAAGYQAAMDKMHREMMALKYTGNADVDFVRGMIPHHQAAIDMANVLLAHGKDPEMRKLAENIVAAQQKEIAEMENWLAAHPAK